MTGTLTEHPDEATATSPAAEESGAGRGFRRGLALLALLVMTLLYLVPLVWMFVTSVKTNPEATQWPLQLLPGELNTEAYEELTRPGTNTPVFRWFLNSLVAATLHALVVLATAAPAAYALARMDFRGRRAMFALILGTLFIPPVIFLMPNYMIVDLFGWLDRLPAVILPLAGGAFGVFLMRQFFLGLPEELEEAALVDGASRFGIFWRIVLPLSKPALATLAVISFLTNWNDFLWPVYVLFSPDSLTLPPGLSQLQGAYITDFPVIMAGGVIASVPVLVLFVAAQRYIIAGVARSGLKG